jgi:hypothetical protein
MENDFEDQEKVEDPSLVNKVSEGVPTDVVTDLKTGIYNLFVSLVHNLIAMYGPEVAITEATSFLDEVSYNFKQVLEENQEK